MLEGQVDDTVRRVRGAAQGVEIIKGAAMRLGAGGGDGPGQSSERASPTT